MARSEAERRRDLRRQAKILRNPEGRINKILGQPEVETPIQQIEHNSSNISVCNDITFDIAPAIDLPENNLDCDGPPNETLLETTLASTSVADNENILSNSSSIPQERHDVLSNNDETKITEENKNRKISIWMILGVITRILLESEYSWVIGNSAMVVFMLAFSSNCVLQLHTYFSGEGNSNAKPSSNGTLVEMALLICGLPSHILVALMRAKRSISNLLETFSLFCVPFVMVHLLSMMLRLDYLSEDNSKTCDDISVEC